MNFVAENVGLLCCVIHVCGMSLTVYLKACRDDLQGHVHCLFNSYTTTPVLDHSRGVIDIYGFCKR